MKNTFVISCLVFTLAACSGGFDAESLRSFPKYEAVYHEAFAHRSMSGDDEWYLHLARKADGWYLVKTDRDQHELKFYLFWSAKEKKYLPFPSEIDRPGETARFNPYTSENNMFKIIPFYGYERWYEDVIANFKDNTDSDTLMEALARAWSAKASAEAGLNYGQNQNEVVRKFTAEQEQAFITNADKALEVYQELEKKNPRYNTFVGGIHNKYSNECMNVYSTLQYFGDPAKAKPYLKDGLYSKFFMSFAENILKSCEPNAVLITYGDNDYYPLIYVQDKLHLRSDVAVLNMSLMTLDVYIEKFIQKYQLKHTLNGKVYENKLLDFVVLSRGQDTVNMTSVLQDFNAGRFDPYLRDGAGKGEQYVMLSNNVLRFNRSLSPLDGPGFYMNLPQSYVFKNDLFLWDLLYSNCPDRKISLTVWGSWNAYLPALKEKGLVYTYTCSVPASDENKAEMDTAVTADLLLKEFTYNWSGKSSDDAETRIAGNYLYSFMKLANVYADAGNREKAILVIKSCLKFFPQETLPANMTYCFLARTLQQCGEEETAINIDLQYLKDMEYALDHSTGQEYEDNVRGVQNIFVLADRQSPKWSAVVQKADALLKKYPAKTGSQDGVSF